MQSFKTGGYVTKKEFKAFEKKEEPMEDVKDIAQDKAVVKKGVAQHESALHKGEPKTELKLKSGGRAKKKEGSVKKYCGGGKTKKMADGGPVAGQGAVTDKERSLAENVMGTPGQNAAATKRLDKIAQEPGVMGSIERGIRSMTGQGSVSDAERKGFVAKKKGGKC